MKNVEMYQGKSRKNNNYGRDNKKNHHDHESGDNKSYARLVKETFFEDPWLNIISKPKMR
jgi:hypothetical protein